MKLIRFGTPDHEKPGVLLDDGRRIDASALGADCDERFFGSDGLERLAAWVTANAMQHVAGYALHNDYSEREWQLERGGQWVRGKSCETFAPLQPFLATADEIPDPPDLPLWLKVNGVTRQNSSTAEMIFGVPKLVSYISQFMILLPGDVISTGTPPGVRLGLKPEPVFLKPGDVVELGIAGLGDSRQLVRAFTGVA